MTLTDFLLARIAEDEELALAASASNPERTWEVREVDYEGMWVASAGYDWPQASGPTDQTDHIENHDPARVLTECEAKRRIVEDKGLTVFIDPTGTQISKFGRRILAYLALPYADHPDYDEAWRA